MSNIQNLPEHKPRVETGAVQFGDDWPGLFIRGDDCIMLHALLGKLGQSDNPFDAAGFEVGRLLDMIEVVLGIKHNDENKPIVFVRDGRMWFGCDFRHEDGGEQ